MSNSIRTTANELIEAVVRQQLQQLGTSVPGHIEAFDPATQLAQLRIGVRTMAGEQLPTIIECPVMFSGGSSYVIEHQLDPGDEGIIIFSQRCLDGWLETGGAAEQPVARLHDFTDAYFIPGIRPKPKAFPSMANEGIALRSTDGSQYLWLKGNGSIEISGDVTVTGTISAPTIEASDSLKVASAEVKAHTHTVSGGNTGPLT